jgi:hypothetical protein
MSIPLLGINVKEYKSTYKKDNCIPMFIATLFTIIKLWNQPRCPKTDESIKKIYFHGVLFSHIWD